MLRAIREKVFRPIIKIMETTTSTSDQTKVFTTEKIEEYNKIKEEHKGKIIGTHSGVFHCDEALACSLLKYSNDFKDSVIIRSRNTEIHDAVDILVDVGSVFDPDNYRFDHHQRGFDQYFNHEKHPEVKMSSAGLIYKYFGKEILTQIADDWNCEKFSDSELSKFHSDFYKSLFLEVDAVDNGVS